MGRVDKDQIESHKRAVENEQYKTEEMGVQKICKGI